MEQDTLRRRASFAALTALLALTITACSDSGSDSGSDAGSTAPDDTGGDSPPPEEKTLDSWVSGLTDQGYTVTQGSATLQDADTCAQMVEIFDSCWGNNPAAPYVLLEPPVSGNHVDPTYAEPFTETLDDGTEVNLFYRMQNSDALVTLVDLPPDAAYLGFNSYMFTRPVDQYDFEDEPQNLSPNPDRVEVFGSANNAVNHEVIANRSGLSFGEGTVAVITTTNQALYEALADNLAGYGLDATLAIPEPLGDNIHPGSDAQADDFFTLMRYAMPVDKDAGDAWRSAAAEHVRVFRVSDPDLAVERYGAVDLTTKQDGDEQRLQPQVDELAGLMEDWLIDYQGAGVAQVPMIASETTGADDEPSGLVGPECIAEGSQCLGDSQDTEAYRFQSIGVLPAGETAVVLGANHTVLGNARYTSVAAYDSESLSGIEDASQSEAYGTLSGSAERVLEALGLIARASPQLVEALPELYVVLISRACPIDTQDCLQIDNEEVAEDASMLLTQRAYLKPGTETGANPDSMVAPITISSGASAQR